MSLQHDLDQHQGDTWQINLTWTIDGSAVDVTGYTAAMQLRKAYDSATATLTLTSAAGDITLGGATGTVDVVADATSTAAIESGEYVYDLEITSGAGVVTKLLWGTLEVLPEVTKV